MSKQMLFIFPVALFSFFTVSANQTPKDQPGLLGQGVVVQIGFKGMPLLQKGDYQGGGYSYIDGSTPLGLILELLENS